jgi:hypothetical protein
MHPTADTPLLKYLQSRGAAGDAGRSAALWHNLNLKGWRAGCSQQKTVAGDGRGVVRFPVLRRQMRALSVARSALSRSTSRPNKRMHPTADTSDFMYINGVARRVMRGVRQQRIAKINFGGLR